MNICCIGDSWTRGYGIDNINLTWPFQLQKKLKSKITTDSEHGLNNQLIFKKSKSKLESNRYDLLFVNWSGVTRKLFTIKNSVTTFSIVNMYDVPVSKRSELVHYFKIRPPKIILNDWYKLISKLDIISNKYNTQLFQFSSFGDRMTLDIDSWIKPSMIEYLSNEMGVYFEYNIPFFEYGMIHPENSVSLEYLDLYDLDGEWERGIVEREMIRPSKNFLECGHPSPAGHKVWAEYLYENT